MVRSGGGTRNARPIILLFLSAAALVLCFGPRVQAAVTGALSFTGSVRLTSTTEDFWPVGGPAGTGTFLVVDPVSGTFAGLAGTTGSILDLNRATSPVGVPLAINNFLTLAALPAVSTQLTMLEPGVFGSGSIGLPPAAGQTATPIGSHYNLTNLSSNSSTLSFVVDVNMSDGVGGPLPYRGVFTAQFADLSFQSMLATLNAGGFVDAAYSAHFTIIPEPACGVIVCCAGLGLARRSRPR